MKNFFGLLFFTLIGAYVTSANATATTAIDTNSEQVIKGFNNFAFDLYHRMSQPDKNLIISPYSLASLFAILVNGTDGNTRTQLIRLLHLENFKDNNNLNTSIDKIDASLNQTTICQGGLACRIKNFAKSMSFSDQPRPFLLANSVWLDKSFNYQSQFMQNERKNKSIIFSKVNFGNNPEKARISINYWVKKKTNDEVRQVIPKDVLTMNTRLILASAIYFKGLWQLPFMEQNTQPKPFFFLNGNKLFKMPLPMMMGETKVQYFENNIFQMIVLPYSKSPLAMAILLPKAKHKLFDILKTFNTNTYLQFLQNSSIHDININLPKFKFALASDSLMQPLRSLGLTDAFNDKADFSNMIVEQMSISDIFQKAIIEIDEKGPADVASIDVLTTNAAKKIKPILFNANHPFIFVVFDTKSKLVLFMGQLRNPQLL